MHRLILPALLSFAIATLLGCGGGESTDGSPSPASTGTGSSQGAGAQAKTSQGMAPQHDTPQAVFASFATATKSKDWKATMVLLTPESQSMFAAGMIIGASFMTMGDETKEKGLQALLQKHGINMDEEPPAGDEDAGPEALTRPIKDLPAFVAEITAWMDEQGKGSDSGFPELGELSDVTIDGDSAKGKVSTDGGPQPIEFRRVGGTWLIHLPTEEPPADVEPGNLDPDAANPPAIESEDIAPGGDTP